MRPETLKALERLEGAVRDGQLRRALAMQEARRAAEAQLDLDALYKRIEDAEAQGGSSLEITCDTAPEADEMALLINSLPGIRAEAGGILVRVTWTRTPVGLKRARLAALLKG